MQRAGGWRLGVRGGGVGVWRSLAGGGVEQPYTFLLFSEKQKSFGYIYEEMHIIGVDIQIRSAFFKSDYTKSR